MGNATSAVSLYGKDNLLNDFANDLDGAHDLVAPPQMQVLQRTMNSGGAGNYTYDRELVEQLKVDRPLPKDGNAETVAHQIFKSRKVSHGRDEHGCRWRGRRLTLVGKQVVVLTGAGVSAASGLPTFRDPTDGIWTRFDPRCATLDGFNTNPGKTWELYREIEYVLTQSPSLQ